MQSRLAVIRCKSFQKTRNNLICSRRKHCQGGENISPTSSLKSSTFPSQNQNLSNLGKTRREYLSPTLNSFHTGVIATRKVSTYHRYVQTSSAPKSPASTLIKPSRSSSAAAAASSLRTSTTEDEVDFFLDSATANITNEAHSSSLYNEVLSNEDDILKFTNENIQRLLHEELQSIENGMQSNEHMSAMDDGMINIDIQQNLKENQMEQQQSKSLQNEQQKTTMAQLLQKFDLQKPPSPEDTPLEEIQHWFEFAAQQESVQKYEDVVQNARDREDYASLSIVQRHMLQWYGPLRERIVEEQEAYYGKKTKTRTANKYGPLLCLLQPEKLAILTMHEATMFSLKKGGSSATLCQIAMKISDAVEAEFNVQRLLKTRMDQGKISMSKLVANDNDENTEIEGSNSVVDISNDERSTKSLDDEEAKETEKKKKDVGNDWMYGPSHLQRFMDELNRADPGRKGKVRLQRANRRARRLLDSSESWSSSDKITLGVVLMKLLMETATVDLNGKNKRNRNNGDDVDYGEPAFVHEKIWMNDNNLVGCIKINEDFYRMVVEDKFSSLDAFTTRHKPMVLPPRDWTSPNDGGYMVLDTDFMRTKGCQIQKSALAEADLSVVMDGLNVLGRVPWVINKDILSAAQKCWDDGIELGDIPSQQDHELPPLPIRPDGSNKEYSEAQGEFNAYREKMTKYRRMHQKNMDLRSLRCSALLKLNQSEQFKDFDKIHFPYNVDFRGRAYPVPPHLSNIGSDLCRGMLTFAEAKPLGSRGLYWLKVHLANLAGNDKISFDERAQFTEDNMDNVRACVNDPFGENRWWMSLDDPFQAKATCHELIKAIDSGSPETYECSLPVHMDGSCNGLQHYAALGRDVVGGKAVNLCASDKPQDVYSGVMEEVIRRVAEEADRLIDIDESNPDKLTKNERKALAEHRAAILVNGLIDRGVVKRTVMTSVYGVTYIGAKKQIQEKIEEKLEAKGVDIDERADEIYSACGYLASATMDVMGDLFQGARKTMNWLTTCARLISSQGQPVTWMSATGVPAVQPYRQRQSYRVVTLLQSVVLINNNDNLPVHKSRQTSAFPPNYIHSLDSAHMLLTAIEMDKRGLAFTAVHDSFWTHPSDIDEMNDALRSCFVDLYNRPLLEELKETWELQYPSLEFPELPERGNLDLNEVKQAPYFFQ